MAGHRIYGDLIVDGGSTFAGAIGWGKSDTSGTERTLTVAGSETNIGIDIVPKGTGIIRVPTGYEDNIASEGRAIINKAYHDANIAGISTSIAAPGADRILFYDHSGTVFDFLSLNSSLGISGTELSVQANTTVQKIAVRKNSTGDDISTRRRLNFIEGSGITITVNEDTTDDEIDITIDSSAGAGSGYSLIQAGGSSLTVRNTLNVFNGLTAVDDGSSKTTLKLGGTTTENTTLTLGTGFYFSVSGGSGKLLRINEGSGGIELDLGSDATGDIYYRNASGVLTRLGVGSDNQVLTLASGIPTWANASGGITNGAASNEITKSNGTNIIGTKVYSTSDGNIQMGDSTIVAVTRAFTADGSGSNVGFSWTPKGAGGFEFVSSGGDFVLSGNDSTSMNIVLSGSGTSNMITTSIVRRLTSSTAAIGFGVQSQVLLENASGGVPTAASWNYSWSDATNTSETCLIYLQGIVSGSQVDLLKFENAGAVFASDVIIADSTKAFYLGPAATDGTWRIIQSGDNLVFQQRESGSYVTKDTISGA